MQSKYKAIYQKYVDMIESGKLSPGDSLPSEGKMTETFDTSRDTIRKAMTLLEQNNYILKSRGKESVVLERLQEESTDAKMFSYLELYSQDGVEREKLVEDISILVDNEKMMREFQIDDTKEVYRIERIEKISGKRIALKKDYYLKEIVPKLTEEICKGSIQEYLKSEGIQSSIIKRKITVSPIKIQLDIGEDKEVVLLQSYYYLESGIVFHYSETRCRLRNFQFIEYIQK